MSFLKTYCEVTIEAGDIDEEGNLITSKENYWLLHFGLKYDIINDMAVNYTVGICESVATGQIQCFLPEQIRIVGQKTKE